jgi:hypothetical protein
MNFLSVIYLFIYFIFQFLFLLFKKNIYLFCLFIGIYFGWALGHFDDNTKKKFQSISCENFELCLLLLD